MLINSLEDFLQDEGWPIQGIVESSFEDEKGLLTAYQGENDTYNCFGIVFETDQRIAFYAKCPFDFPLDKLSAISEFLHRANFDMVIGNFELNYDKQEIRFKTSVDVEGTSVTHSLLEGLIYPTVMTMDLYLPLIKRVIYSSEKPIEILESSELEVFRYFYEVFWL